MAPSSRDFGSTAFAVEGFTRFVDNLLTKQMLDQRSKTSYTNTLLQSVAGLDSVIIDPSMSIADAVSKFMNAAGTLANDDQNLTNKQNFAGAATQLATRISSFNEYLNDIKRSTQTNMSGILNESNSLSTALRGINQKILASSSPGYSTPSADLLDERDRITMRLQDLLGGSTIINEDGTATFQIGGVSLVDRMSANQFFNTDIGISDGAIFNVFMKTEQTGQLVGPLSTNTNDTISNPNIPTQIKSIFTSGQAGAAFEILAKFIPNLQREVNALTLGIFRDVNSIKNQDTTAITPVFGFKESGGGFNTTIPTELTTKYRANTDGTLILVDGKYAVDTAGTPAATSRVLKIEEIMAAADPTSSYYLSSIAKVVNNEVPNKTYGASSFVSRLAYGPELSLPQNFSIDATAANSIQQLRTSFSNPLSTITNDVAATISSWKNTDQVNQVISKQLSDRRESISGINLDEEAANLVKFQQMYGAASKVMQTANQMFNLLLNMLSE
jgi:flagellar hook-associated protein 1